jgi:quinoprotein glucose dehydrogenase
VSNSSRVALPFFIAVFCSACSPSTDSGPATDAPAAAPPPATAAPVAPPAAGQTVEWPFYGGNLASQRYSALDQIDASNAGQLKIAWRFATGNFGPRPELRNENTPLMIDGVLYTHAGITRNVVALDPKSGELLWVWRPNDGAERFARAPRKTSGRGPAYRTDGAGNERLFTVTPGFYLAALDPDTGRPVPGFGENGIVDLMIGVRGEVNDKSSIGNSSPALVVGDVVIVGPAHEVGMRPPSKANLKGDVRGYDVRSGKLLWTFHDPGAASRATRLAQRLADTRCRRVGADDGRRRARLRVLADRSTAGRHVGRRAPRQQSL